MASSAAANSARCFRSRSFGRVPRRYRTVGGFFSRTYSSHLCAANARLDDSLRPSPSPPRDLGVCRPEDPPEEVARSLDPGLDFPPPGVDLPGVSTSVTPRPLPGVPPPFGDAGAEPDPRGVRDPDPPDRDVSFPQASPVSIRVKSRRVEPPPGDSGSDSDSRADRSLATSRSVPTRSCRSLGCNSSRASSKASTAARPAVCSIRCPNRSAYTVVALSSSSRSETNRATTPHRSNTPSRPSLTSLGSSYSNSSRPSPRPLTSAARVSQTTRRS